MVCERFNRTIKEKIWRVFTHNSIQKKKFPHNYKNFLKDIINSYNNSYHRSIKTTPAKVNKNNAAKIYFFYYLFIIKIYVITLLHNTYNSS